MTYIRLIPAILILVSPLLSHANEDTIALLDKSCVLSGPDDDSMSIKTTEGSIGASICKLEKNDKYRCSYSPKGKDAKVTEIVLDYANINAQTKILSNESGNIKVIINIKKKSFSWGQANALIDQGVVINKYCVGYVLNKKEVSEILKDTSSTTKKKSDG